VKTKLKQEKIMGEKKILEGAVLPTKVVVIEEKEDEKVSKGGLILVERKRNSNVIGEVVLVGEGTEKLPMLIKIGSRVIYTPLSAQEFTVDDVTYKLLDQTSVLFVLPPSK
jgi:co-chaperonin GroES (HSP10)